MSGENLAKTCAVKLTVCNTFTMKIIKLKKRQNILVSWIVYNADIPVWKLFKNEISKKYKLRVYLKEMYFCI